MGRSLIDITTTATRSQGNQEVYPRRPPQIGASFQLRTLPERMNQYVPSRTRLPLPYSMEHPHRTEEELAEERATTNSESMQVDDESSQSNNATVLDNNIEEAVLGYETTTTTQRGGTLLHRRVEPSSSAVSSALWFSSGSSSFWTIPSTTTSLWEWSWELRQWQEHHTDATRRSRGTTQRKHVALPTSLTKRQQQQQPLSQSSSTATTSDSERAWHYAHRHHRGHLAQASLAVLAAWGAGHQAASSATTTKYAWRDVVQHRLCILSGDYGSDDTDRCWTGVTTPATDWDTDVLHGTWDAVLHCAALVLQQATASSSSSSSTTTRLWISSVTKFLVYASQLPEAMDVSISRHVNTTMEDVTQHLVTARQERAHLLDLWQTPSGVDVDSLRKLLDKSRCCIVPDEMDEMKRQVRQVAAWQQRLEDVYAQCSTMTTTSDESGAAADPSAEQDDLTVLQDLLQESQHHGFVAKSAAQLQQKLEKAYSIRDRIHDVLRLPMSDNTAHDDADATTHKPALKTITSIVRDIHRLKIRFAAVNTMLAFHQRIEAWVDRATIASRSRLSLEEVSELITTGAAMPVDLSDHVAKLSLRVEAATEWIERFHDVIEYDGVDRWTIIHNIRAILDNDEIYRLQDLATEGSRMPVEVEKIQLLQVELDAYAWSVKMTKWIGNCGKLSELREHKEKATALRERLLVDDKTKWTLRGEDELTGIVAAADQWLEEAEQVLSKKQCVPVHQFRTIQQKGNLLDVSLGGPMSKITKIVAQADKWLENHHSLVLKLQSKELVVQAEIEKAVATATEVGANFNEAVELNALLCAVKKWMNLFDIVVGETTGDPLSLEQVTSLLKESTLLPIETQRQCAVLEERKRQVEHWQQNISVRIEAFLSRLECMQQTLSLKYGDPSRLTWAVVAAKNYKSNNASSDSAENTDRSMCVKDLCPTLGAQAIQDALDELRQEAASFSIKTPETQAFEESFNMLRWIFQSIDHMHSQRFIFDKRFFGAFDRFVKEPKSINCGQYDRDLLSRVIRHSAVLVKDQAHRLQCLLSLRQRYVKVCKQAQQVLVIEKPSYEKLKEVSKTFSAFPKMDDPLKSLTSRLTEAQEWITEVKRTLDNSGKISQGEAIAFLSQADSIGFVCDEAALLRNGVKAAKNWVRRARKYCKEEKLDPAKVENLIKEYEPLVIGMPEDFEKLKKSCTKYCVCRRVYSGFMIQCDECEDWFHGPCVGLTESSVKKKYVCVRCGIRKAYNSSSVSIANTVRKWSSLKEIQKVRDHDERKVANKVAKQAEAIKELETERAAIEVKLKDSVQESRATAEIMDVDDGTPAPEGAATTDGAIAGAASPCATNVVDREEPTGSTTSISSTSASSGNELSVALNVIQHKLEMCATKLEKITAQRETLMKRYKSEDVRFIDLKHWFLKIRSLIMAPASEEVALASRPNADGSLSSVMVALQNEAKTSGLYKFSDVKAVMNQIQCLAFCLRATTIFSRKPSTRELESLVKQAADITGVSHLLVPVRTLKGFLGRYKTWEYAVFDELTPIPSLTTTFNEAKLNELAAQADRLPFRSSLRDRIATVLEDSARRHCLCGGPSDGRFMIGCDGCDKWFHGHCVGVGKKTPEEELTTWICPQCANAPLHQLDVLNFHSHFDVSDDESDSDHEDASALTPKPDDMWPPLGLLYSDRAIKALGADCCALPDNSQIRALAETTLLEMEFAPMESAPAPGSHLMLKPASKPEHSEVLPPPAVSSAEVPQSVQSTEPEAPLSIQQISLKRPSDDNDAGAATNKKQRTEPTPADQP